MPSLHVTIAKLNNAPWPFNRSVCLYRWVNKVTIKGQPDLSRLPPLCSVCVTAKGTGVASDDGLNKTGTVWFDDYLNRLDRAAAGQPLQG